MERDAVAFTVENNGAVTVGTDRVLGFEDLAAIGCDRGDRLVQAPVGVEIKERPFDGGLFTGMLNKTAADIALAVRQDAYRRAGDLFFVDLCAQHGGIEFNGAVEILYRDVHPNDLV